MLCRSLNIEGTDCGLDDDDDDDDDDDCLCLFSVQNMPKCIRLQFNVAMICQTVVKPPVNGLEMTRDSLTCRIQYSANGEQQTLLRPVSDLLNRKWWLSF